MRFLIGLWILSGVLLTSPYPDAHAQPSPEDLPSIIARADSLRRAKDFESAESLLQAVLPDLENPRDRSRVLISLGHVYRLSYRLPLAQETLQEAVRMAELSGDSKSICQTVYSLAASLEDQGGAPEMVSHYLRVIELSESSQDRSVQHLGGRALLGLFRRNRRSGEFETARDQCEKAIKVFQELGDEKWQYKAKYRLGILESQSGNPDAARTLWLDGLAWARQKKNSNMEANCLTNLGRVEIVHGDPGQAVAHWREAYRIHKEQGNVRAGFVPGLNAAIAMRESGRFDESAQFLTELLDMSREHSFRDHEISALINLAEVDKSRLHLRPAARRYRQALALLKHRDEPTREYQALKGLTFTLAETDSLDVAIELMLEAEARLRDRLALYDRCNYDWRLGELLVQGRRHELALAHLHRALSLADQAGRNRLPQEILSAMGMAHRSLAHPDSALHYLRRAAAAWEAGRALPEDRVWREIQGARGERIGTELADILLEHPTSNPYDARAKAAFSAMQRFKARTLLERIAEQVGAQPDSLVQIPEAVDLTHLQKNVLRPGELLLESYLGPHHSFIFAVTTREFRVTRLPGYDTGFYDLVDRYQGLFSASADQSEQQIPASIMATMSESVASELFSGINDLIADCRRIIFVPDGLLHGLSLGSLCLAGDGETKEPLLTSHQVVRIPSCTLLAWQRRKPEDGPTAPSSLGVGRVLALADRMGPDGQELSGAVQEVQDLGRQYHHVEVRFRDGSPDTTFSPATLAPYQILHFAAHTEVDNQRPWHSGVCLGPSNEDVLRASDIANLQLAARLAVLSGCATGGGRVMSGEGVLGLSSAFLCAGVPAVVATIWPVSDQVTSLLMARFYNYLADGRPAASALRSAQLDLRADETTSHPLYWAGFILVGDGDGRVELQRKAVWERWRAEEVLGAIAIPGAMVLGIVWLLRRRR